MLITPAAFNLNALETRLVSASVASPSEHLTYNLSLAEATDVRWEQEVHAEQFGSKANQLQPSMINCKENAAWLTLKKADIK